MNHRILVFTFKEGLLSRIAHDLRFHIERFEISRDGDEIVARFWPDSIVVDGVMNGERFDPGGLAPRDRTKVIDTIRGELLRVRSHPTVDYRGRIEIGGEGRHIRVAGELELLGVRRPLVVAATREGGRIGARVTLRPSEFGLPPYKALAGAIRLQDRVRLDLDLDAELLA